jgi:hypothetical protein
MALTDASDMLTLSTALGDSDANLQTTVDTGTSTSCLAKLITARQSVDTLQSESDYDSALAWQNSLRGIETTLEAAVDTMLRGACTGANTYFQATQSTSFKSYWHAESVGRTVAWTSNFRALWRRCMSEELVVRLGSITRGSAWGSYVANTTISVASTLDVRAATLIGASDITLTLTLTTEDDDTDIQVLTIPAATASGTVFAINGAAKYKAVVGASATGGTIADSLDIWVRP